MYLEVEIESADREIDFEVISDQLNVEDIMTLVHSLPSGYRTVFNLYAIEGYSHAEIAKQLNINVNTSKSQLSRARILLQKKLADLEKIAEPKIIEHGK